MPGLQVKVLRSMNVMGNGCGTILSHPEHLNRSLQEVCMQGCCMCYEMSVRQLYVE